MNLPERVPIVVMRGGTSKCAMFIDGDLPVPGASRDALLLSLFGSPDPRQIDGIGGATSSTSKACIIAASERPDTDVDYTFGQIDIQQALVDYGGNCGNCSSAVGPFALESGLVEAPSSDATMVPVRIFNTNTGTRIVAEVAVKNGRPSYTGTYVIAGVPGGAAPQRLWFYKPGGGKTGKLLPTGHASDILDVRGRSCRVTLIDAANPFVLVRAADVGLTGTESPQQIDGMADVMAMMQEIRGQATVLMGLVDRWEDAERVSPSIPKVGVVAEPQGYRDLYGRDWQSDEMHGVARMLSMARCHGAYPLTGAIATATAAKIPGTVAHDSWVESDEVTVRFGHPSGVIEVDIDIRPSGDGWELERAGVYRTARKMWEGWVYPRQPAE